MKLPMTWTVTKENGPRPAGHPDECFYCQQPIGSQHKPDCVLRERTVVVRLTVEYPIRIPEFWTTEDLEFHRNEGTWCSNNLVDDIEKLRCVCGQSEFKYVREATADDDDLFKTAEELAGEE